MFITETQQRAGKLAYRFVNPQKIDVFTTQVLPEFQGQGIAGALYNALIEFAERDGLKIKPSCSYIEKRMERSHPQLIA